MREMERTHDDAAQICESLVKGDACIASAQLVDIGGRLATSFGILDDVHAAAVSAAGVQLLTASADEKRPCARTRIDELMSCIAMEAGGEALVVVFFDEPAVFARLPSLMARAVAKLRTLPRGPRGGSGGTPNEARAFVSVRDLDDDVS